jgi:hypothetical protein
MIGVLIALAVLGVGFGVLAGVTDRVPEWVDHWRDWRSVRAWRRFRRDMGRV